MFVRPVVSSVVRLCHFRFPAAVLLPALVASAQTMPPARTPVVGEGDPVTLSVFEVTGERDTGYAASTAMWKNARMKSGSVWFAATARVRSLR
jgi:hypothetical protein